MSARTINRAAILLTLFLLVAAIGFITGNSLMSRDGLVLDILQDQIPSAITYPGSPADVPLIQGRVVYSGSVPENRIVRIYNPDLNDWNYNQAGGYYFYQYTDLAEYDATFKDGLMELTQTSNMYDAWDALLTDYQAGDDIAIKINLNSYDENANQDPKMPYVIVQSLKNDFGVSPAHIKVYDAIRRQPTWFRNQWTAYNTGVQLVNDQSVVYDGSNQVTFSQVSCSSASDQRIPTIVTGADHLINVHLMKGHKGYVTGAMKNHFGTVECPSCLHETGRQCNIGYLGAFPGLAEKTRLYISEATYMTSHAEGVPFDEPRFNDLFPLTSSGHRSPNSFFFAVNSMVMDSVMGDFLNAERSYRRSIGVGCGYAGTDDCLSWSNTFLDYAYSLGYTNVPRQTGTLVDTPGSFSTKDFSYSTFDYVSREVGDGGDECSNGQTQSCYSGPAGTAGVGICQAGLRTCSNGQWGSCVGQVLPIDEICGNGQDDDCDGDDDASDADCMACEIVSAHFGLISNIDSVVSQVEEPEEVYVVVDTAGCIGDQLSVSIVDFDNGAEGTFIAHTASLTIDSARESFVWTSEWFADAGDASPDQNEYKIKATIPGVGTAYSEVLLVDVDTTPPLIDQYGLEISVGPQSANIHWGTTEESNYSLVVNGQTFHSGSFTSSHAVSVSGLSPLTSYPLELLGCDVRNNCFGASDSFTTSEPVTSITLGFSSLEDTKVSSSGADINWGAKTTISVNEDSNFILMRWDLSGYEGLTLESALLRVFNIDQYTPGQLSTASFYPMLLNRWVEGSGNGNPPAVDGATYNEYDFSGTGANPWTNGNIADEYSASDVVMASDTKNQNAWLEFDLTDLVELYLDGSYDWSNGFFMSSDTYLNVYSSEYSLYAPELVLNFAPGAICLDGDHDGFGYPGDSSCPGGPQDDCHDGNAQIYPGAVELCNNIDDNCAGGIDETFTAEQCSFVCSSGGFTWTGNGGALNCCGNDAFEGSPFQSVESSCSDGNDNDCDGLADYADPDCDTCSDLDGDGYGFPGDPSCPAGDELDCDDDPGECGADCNPGILVETGAYCRDGFDNDCDGLIDYADDCVLEDVNDDGDISLQDLLLVFNDLSGPPISGWTDVNGDGRVSIVDVILVARALG